MSKKGKKRDDEDEDDKKSKKKKKKGKMKRRKATKFVYRPSSDDFKAFFVEIGMTLGKDGVIRDVRAVRVKGRPDSESAKRVDMEILDPKTFKRLIARLAAATFIKSEHKRLPKFSAFKILIRVAVQNKTGGLRVTFKKIKMREGKDGKFSTLEKKTPEYRAIRKANKFLPAAFTDAVEFPKGKELKKLLAKAEGSDEDDGEKEDKGKKRKKKKKKKK